MYLTRSLSGRLLLMTVIIVMITEIFVFLPSVARFRQDFLLERLQMAQIASLALLAADDAKVEEALERELLANAEVSTIVLRRDQARQLILRTPMPTQVAETYDLRDATVFDLIADAMVALFRTEERVIRVIGQPVLKAGEVIEITLAEPALSRAIRAYSQRIFLLSLMISAITGFLVFLLCRRLIVRPMENVVNNMVAFQSDPEGAPVAEPARPNLIEIAQAEVALAAMQRDVKTALRQKSHLAELGVAVAKISHDLRNMLSTAQLMADRLEGSQDPLVARIGPKLIGSIDRAVNLCVSTLKHGKAEETPPEQKNVVIRKLVDEVADAVFVDGAARCVNETPADLAALADPEHLFRILGNLLRNAGQAIESSGRGGAVTITAEESAGRIEIRVSDDGPGIPAQAMENLFQPFIGSVSRGGSGLGLAIAVELATVNGGALTLLRSTTEGTTFLIDLPAP